MTPTFVLQSLPPDPTHPPTPGPTIGPAPTRSLPFSLLDPRTFGMQQDETAFARPVVTPPPVVQPADASRVNTQPVAPFDFGKLADLQLAAMGFAPPHPGMTTGERLQNAAALAMGLIPEAAGTLRGVANAGKIADRAAEAMEAGGATLEATGEPWRGSGYLIADPEFTRTLAPHEDASAAIRKFLSSPSVKERLQQPGAHIGVYKDPTTGVREINVTDHLPEEVGESTARQFAAARNQRSFGHQVNGNYLGEYPTNLTGRRVAGVALRTQDGAVHAVPLPGSHLHVLDKLPPGSVIRHPSDQGFVLDDGSYVTRETAMDVAEREHEMIPGRTERNRANPRDLHAFDLTANQPKPPAPPSYRVEDEGPAEHLANAQSILNMHEQMSGSHATLDPEDFAAVRARLQKAGVPLSLSPQSTIGDLQAQLRGIGTPSASAMPLEDVVDEYRANAGLSHEPLPPVGKVDPEAGAHMARVYDRLESAPNDPQVQQAYRQFSSEVGQQAKALRKAGYSWEFTDKDPYASSRDMLKDLNENHHIKVFRTQPGQGHPLLSNAENDEFRAVHEILGHGTTKSSFGPRGEEQAFRNHAALFSPDAQRVLATETRGQNSWFNYGPHRDLPAPQRPFAQQKAALWPQNLLGDYPAIRRAANIDLPEGAPSVLGASDYSLGARPAGEPGTVYHGTYKPDFSIPTESRDLGPHVGTPAQASTITDTMRPQGHRIMPLRDFTKNPARVPEDPATWDDPGDAADALVRSGHIEQPLADEIHDAHSQQFEKVQQHMAAAENEFKERNGRGMTLGEYSKVSNQFNEDYKNALHDKLRKALIDKGYDSVLYPNAYEGRGLTIKHVEGRRPTFEDPETESKIVLNPKRDLQNALEPRTLGGSPATPAGRQGTVLPEQDVTPLAQAVAHHTAGTTDFAGFLKNLQQHEPGLAGLNDAAPGVMQRLYKGAQAHQQFVEGLTPFDDLRKLATSDEGKGIANWYGGLRKTLTSAGVPEHDADMLDRFGSILSAQKSPKDEMAEALRAWEAWSHGEPIDARAIGTTEQKAKALRSQAQGGPFSLGEKPGAFKTADYYLNRRGLTHESAAIDRHVMRAYGVPDGPGGTPAVTPAQYQVLKGRMLDDAKKAGMPLGEWQARVWGGQTKYSAAFGKEGAPLEEWLKYHLAGGDFDRLLERYPGLQGLAEEGAKKAEDLTE